MGGDSRLRSYLVIPAEPALLEAHAVTVLTRTRIAGVVAMIVMPVTIFFYFNVLSSLSLSVQVIFAVAADVAVAALLASLKTPLMRRHYQLAFFLLVGVICSFTEAGLLQLSGGGAGSSFLFPYFLILFGIATLFPSSLGWAIASSVMCPLTYVGSEVWARGRVEGGRPVAALLLLLETAFITIWANRESTQTYFSELQARKAAELANAQLLQLDKAKADFFANLSHDLKTPLNLILGPVQAVMRQAPHLDDRSRRYLETALRGARRLDGMVNDLLDLAKIDAGVGRLSLSRVDLRRLVGQFVESITAYASSVGQTVELEATDEQYLAEVDPDKVERVLANLVANALKFSGPGSAVRVRLSQTEAEASVSVTDQGPGIPLEEQHRIFERFARGKDASGRTRGAGVGLAVVREFVELHHGRVAVRSAPGRGATFQVTLPKEGPPPGEEPGALPPITQPEVPATAPGVPGTPSEARPHLLLVEDDDETRVFLSSELGRGAEVIAVADGETALRMAEQRPDIILLDVSLPGMDGIETCRRLRRDPRTRTTPILVFSARGDLETRLRSFEAGADDFVHKPVDPLELRARIESLLRRAGRLESERPPGSSPGDHSPTQPL